MAARTTAANVKAILDNTTLTTAQIEAYITSADIMITQVLGTTLSVDALSEICRWLSAHMIALTRERQAIKEEAGTAKITYSDIFKKGGMSSTTYGQMCIVLDTTGVFSILALGLRSASIYAVTSFE
jgi:hypothetical protein